MFREFGCFVIWGMYFFSMRNNILIPNPTAHELVSEIFNHKNLSPFSLKMTFRL